MDDLWKTALGIASAGLTGAVAWVWRKADNAATKEELKEAMKHFQETTKTLFENAEKDRRRYDERFTDMQKTIHGVEVEVLRRMK